MTAKTKIPPREVEDVRLTIGLILLTIGWNFKTLSSRAGIARGELSKYVHGLQRASRKTWEKIEAATKLPLEELEAVLPALRRLRAAAEGGRRPARRPAIIAHTVARSLEAILRLEEPYLPEPAAAPVPRSPEAADRRLAEDLWVRLSRREPSARLALVEEAPAYRSWALVERLCAESVRAAAEGTREVLPAPSGRPGRKAATGPLRLGQQRQVWGQRRTEEPGSQLFARLSPPTTSARANSRRFRSVSR